MVGSERVSGKRERKRKGVEGSMQENQERLGEIDTMQRERERERNKIKLTTTATS